MFRDNLNKSHLQNEQPTFSLNESWYFEFLRRSCPSSDDRYVEEKNETLYINCHKTKYTFICK